MQLKDALELPKYLISNLVIYSISNLFTCIDICDGKNVLANSIKIKRVTYKSISEGHLIFTNMLERYKP